MSTSIIVVPCYNEASRLDVEAFKSFVGKHDNLTILFADDGSSDGTPEILERIRETNPGRFAVLRLARNMGKAEAVRQGLTRACELGSTYVGFWDADLATPLEEIVGFAKLLDERPTIEMVFGARVKLLGRSVLRNPTRHYLGRVFATFAALALGVDVYDTQCGAKLFRATERFATMLREPFIGGWIFDIEILAREIRARRGTTLPPVSNIIYEYPLPEWRDVGGSKLKVRHMMMVWVSLWRIYTRYLLAR